MRGRLALLLVLFIGYALILTVAEMPLFGEPGNPADNMVSHRYLESSVQDTGAVNVVAAIILDYRAYDTLGEATVLFTAISATTAAIVAAKSRGQKT
ncbi:MAG: hydrogen gas-evolving membrane-bound hydrogenase subunit E [Bacillota bacterium]